MARSSGPHTAILWAQVAGLAVVQGSIALVWVIYNLYLGKLLGQLGFSQSWVVGILVVENGLAIVMEPLMGTLSDQAQRWMGSRFLWIALGMIVSAGMFLLIPAVVLLASPGRAVAWVLPIVLVAWAMAMTLFRSPALSLLGRYALTPQLPQAASLLTLMGALVGVVGAQTQALLLSLGPVATFAVGSVALLMAALVLRAVKPQAQVQTAGQESGSTVPIRWGGLVWVFGLGASVAVGVNLLRFLLISPNLSGAGALLPVFTVIHLVTILPCGWLAIRWGNRSAMLLGMALLSVGLVAFTLVALPAFGFIWVALWGCGLSLVNNGTIPFALSRVPRQKAGLGTGLFFGGASLGTTVFATIVQSRSDLPVLVIGLMAALAFVAAALCIGASREKVA